MIRHFIAAGCALMALSFHSSFAAMVITFDELASNSNPFVATEYPGDVYEDQCLLLSSGRVSNTQIVELGQTFTIDQPLFSFDVYNNPASAISDPNYGAAKNGHDLLMTFTSPVVSLAVTTDEWIEDPDLVYLMVLKPTANPNEFEIVQFVSGLDNAVTAPGNLLKIDSPVPFSYAMFMTFGELEGIDNIMYEKAPEPATVLLAALALGCVAVGRRFKR